MAGGFSASDGPCLVGAFSTLEAGARRTPAFLELMYLCLVARAHFENCLYSIAIKRMPTIRALAKENGLTLEGPSRLESYASGGVVPITDFSDVRSHDLPLGL